MHIPVMPQADFAKTHNTCLFALCIFALITSLHCYYLCYDYSQSQLFAIQLWIDAFMIATTFFPVTDRSF